MRGPVKTCNLRENDFRSAFAQGVTLNYHTIPRIVETCFIGFGSILS